MFIVYYEGSVANFERVVNLHIWIHMSTKHSHLWIHTSIR